MGEGSADQATPVSLPSFPFRPHTAFVRYGRSGRLLSHTRCVVVGSRVRECMLRGRLCGRVSRHSIMLGVYRVLWSPSAAGEQARRASGMLVGPRLDGRGRLGHQKDLWGPDPFRVTSPGHVPFAPPPG